MCSLKLLATVFLLLADTARAAHSSTANLILLSCEVSLAKFNFACGESFSQCACTYDPFIQSLLHCISTYSPTSYTKAVSIFQQRSCPELSDAKIKELLQNNTVFHDTEDPDFNSSDALYAPVLPSRETTLTEFRDLKAFMTNLDNAQSFGTVLILFWVAVLVWFGVVNRMKGSRLGQRMMSRLGFIRQYLTLPLMSSSRFKQIGILTMILPTTLEFAILSVYNALHLYFVVSNYNIYKENTIFRNNVTTQVLRYAADRTGIIAFSQLPLLILFGGRNNILIGVSQLPFSVFMIFHKWIGRIMILDSVLHTILYLGYMMVIEDWIAAIRREFYLQAGLIGVVALAVVLIQSLNNFRNAHYEVFLGLHIVLGVAIVWGCWEHCKNLGWLEWIFAAGAIWALDRAARLVKLFKFGIVQSQLDFITDDTFTVRFTKPDNWHTFPGCYVFIHFLDIKLFWQSHPFTIIDSMAKEGEVCVFIKTKDGITAKLKEMIIASGGSLSMNIAVEGPYGTELPLSRYSSLLFITSGNGVPGPLYHYYELLSKPLIPKQRMKFVWIIRSLNSLKWLKGELLKLRQFDNVHFEIYVTRDVPKGEYEDEVMGLFNTLVPFVRFYRAKFSAQKYLSSEVEKTGDGSLGIVTCGHPLMCDDVRNAVADSVGSCSGTVDLFEELQVW